MIQEINYFGRLDADVIERLCSFLNSPVEIVAVQSLHVKTRFVYTREPCPPPIEAIQAYIRDATFWKRYFKQNFSAEGLKDQHLNIPTDEIAVKVCKLAALFYRAPNPFEAELDIPEKPAIESVKEAISFGYEITVARLLKKVQFKNTDEAIDLLTKAHSGKQTMCYKIIMDYLLPILNVLMIAQSSEEKQSTLNHLLFMSAHLGIAEYIKVLIEKGANKNINNKLGYTPLHEVVRSGNGDALKMLIRLEQIKKSEITRVILLCT